MTAGEAETCLHRLTGCLLNAVRATRFDIEPGRGVGTALVEGNYGGGAALRRTMAVLGAGFADELAEALPGLDPCQLRARAAALAGAVAEGFTKACGVSGAGGTAGHRCGQASPRPVP